MIKAFQNANLSSLEDSINEFLVNHKNDPTYNELLSTKVLSF